MGRHKIPIKMIEKKEKRHVCFSKRRKGLFSKAKQLARTGSEIAIIVFSDFDKIFTFSNRSVESVAVCFLSQQNIKDRSSKNDNFHGNANFVYPGFDAARGGLTGPTEEGETSNKGDELDGTGNTVVQDKGFESDHEDDELQSMTGSSKAEGSNISVSSQEGHMLMHDGKHGTGEEETSIDETLYRDRRFWWNKRIDNLELHELVEFESALMELREKVRDQANQILVKKPVMGYYLDFSNYKFKFDEQAS